MIARGASVVALALLGLLGSCTEGYGPGHAPASAIHSLIISSPVQSSASARAGSSGAASVATVAYVSLPPGSVPDGVRAEIVDQASGQFISVSLVDGGFDPVAITANIGDTLVAEVVRSDSADILRISQVVSASSALRVVRTSPPPGKHDVPLNASIIVVFSAPVDSSTITSSSVQLWRALAAVPGTVRFADSTETRAEFIPAGELSAQSNYHLAISVAVRDVNGMALADPVSVPFTTGNDVGQASTVAIYAPWDTITTTPGLMPVVGLTGTVLDSAGTPLAVPIHWSSSNGNVAIVDQTGYVTGVGAGTTNVTAEYKHTTATRSITVLPGFASLEYRDSAGIIASGTPLTLKVGQRAVIFSRAVDGLGVPVDVRQYTSNWVCERYEGLSCQADGTVAFSQLSPDSVAVMAIAPGHATLYACFGSSDWLTCLGSLGNVSIAVIDTVAAGRGPASP